MYCLLENNNIIWYLTYFMLIKCHFKCKLFDFYQMGNYRGLQLSWQLPGMMFVIADTLYMLKGVYKINALVLSVQENLSYWNWIFDGFHFY